MDGRDFGSPRSVHVPPPLLAGLAMEAQRLGAAAAAGRIAPSPGHLGTSHPPPLHSGKFMPSPLNIHPHHSDVFPGSVPFLSGYSAASHLTSDPAYRAANPSNLQMAQLWASHGHEGLSALPSSLYPAHYLSLGHLDGPALTQHPLYDSHKEGFYLPSSLSQSALLPPPGAPPLPPSTSPPQRTSRDGGRDRPYRADREREQERERDRERDRERQREAERDGERERLREEARPYGVVDLTQDRGGDGGRGREQSWPFPPHTASSPRSRPPRPPSHHALYPGSEGGRE
ncbi:trinucleotide repeat-containing gene 18 protein, partial [Gadus morhua]|uniref:trinucleotide repeat-containing gene 18 protein n=1 Tax=Gadus morhua TaxID=8049 RepID=UPI0011B5C186